MVEAEQTFKGSVYHRHLTVMQKIAELDPTALLTVKKGQTSIGDFLSS